MKLKIFAVLVAMIVLATAAYLKLSAPEPKVLGQDILAEADVKVNGDRPWDITVHNEDFYLRVLQDGSLGLGESYVEGWWDSPALDQFFFKVLRANLDEKITQNWSILADIIKTKIVNYQSPARATEVGEKHYDLGNDLFSAMLDPRLIYSCAYWPRAANLDEAQEHKLDLLCQKLDLKPGMQVLDIGCGWGGFASYAAQKYGANVVGITVSKEQVAFANEKYNELPIDIRLQDYRTMTGQFDRIVSVGMFEHVGPQNYDAFMQVVDSCLKDDGLVLLHTIGGNTSTPIGDAWITKYIFPNGTLPSFVEIAKAAEGRFIIEDWHNFGTDYDKTLMAWFERFDEKWPELREKYGDQFYRMWKYYLLACAGMFRARSAQLWQIVLSKQGVLDGYVSVR